MDWSNINDIKDFAIAVSAFGTLITVVISIVNFYREYKLKLKNEERLNESSRIEADIKLLSSFTQLMNIAHSRNGSYQSEKAVEKLLETNITNDIDFNNLDDLGKLSKKIERISILNVPVGAAAQISATCAIGELAEKYEILRNPAIEGLSELKKFVPIANIYYDRLKNKKIDFKSKNTSLQKLVHRLLSAFIAGR